MGNIGRDRGKLLYREMKVDHANVHENIYKFNQKKWRGNCRVMTKLISFVVCSIIRQWMTKKINNEQETATIETTHWSICKVWTF